MKYVDRTLTKVVDGLEYKVQYRAIDFYNGGDYRIGCHMAGLVNVNTFTRPQSEARTWDLNSTYRQVAPVPAITPTLEDIGHVFVDMVMADLATGAALTGLSYPNRSHWLLTANYVNHRSGAVAMRSADFMQAVLALCEKNPSKYGTCVMSRATDNMAHPGMASTCAMIWTPAYVKKPAGGYVQSWPKLAMKGGN